MGRKLVVLRNEGSEAVLEEVLAPNEPIEVLELAGPLLVIGQPS